MTKLHVFPAKGYFSKGLLALVFFYCNVVAVAQEAAPGRQQAEFTQESLKRLLSAIQVQAGDDTANLNGPRLVMTDRSAVNSSHNPGLAPDYLGLPTFHNRGVVRIDGSHVALTGYTRGWEAGTCVLAVVANAPANNGSCTQGGFWDPGYRWVYPGQDSAAAYFGINGITPVIRDQIVTQFGQRTLTNPGGKRQVVGTVVLQAPLLAEQARAINDSAGPMRVQVSNGFFAYTLPPGFSLEGIPVQAADAEQRTILVDNWVRAVQPNNAGSRGAPGATATLPTFPFWTPTGDAAGTGLLPNQVGYTNGSEPLPNYSVTVDGNMLADAQYGGFRITDADIVNDARYLEIVGVNNKTGTPTWNELQPTDDMVDGKPMMTHLMFGGCQNDDGVGLGICGAMLVGSSGLKRVVVCSNPQSTRLEGSTECVLDTSSSLGWKSTKSSGYVLWIDPEATGAPRAVIDWAGNMNTQGRVFVGTGTVGVTLSADGSANATSTVRSGGDLVAKALVVPGSFKLAALPRCSAETLGAHVFVLDGRKPTEHEKHGSGVPADCVPQRAGSMPVWLSAYSQTAVSQ